LPNDWRPRAYQLPAWSALEQGCKRAVLNWHRRSGKDDIALNWTAVAAIQKPANYWHMLPQANQARKAIWDAVNPHTGKRRIDQAFPPEIRRRTRDNEMSIELLNGATWQVVGSDNYQSLIGSPPYGVVYSEYALSDPNCWAFLRQILLENGGWALFISTPRGRNHFHGLVELARSEPGWFGQTLTVRDTGVLTAEQIEKERREIAKERGDDEATAIIGQEYYCSFDAAIPGAYYGTLMSRAEAEGRITDVPVDPRLPVTTAWDLGVGDSTAIWFAQQDHYRTRLVDYYEASGVGADHYARVLNEKGYNYAGHILPHDADDREWGANALSRVDSLKQLGLRNIRVLPRASVDDGINAVRILLMTCVIDRQRCERGIACLREYQKQWDDKLRIFSNKPRHDWTSHGADSLRYYAQGSREPAGNRAPRGARPTHARM